MQKQEEQTATTLETETDQRTGSQKALGALAYSNFRTYWFSAMSFVMGWQILRIVLSWEGYALTDSALFLGYLGGAMAVGTLSVNLIGGVIADRVNRRLLLIATQSSMTVVVGFLVVLSFSDLLAPWHLLVSSAIIGIIQGIDQPTRTAIIPALIEDKRDLMNGLALGSAVWQGTRIFGPSIGGVLIKLVGVAFTFATVTVGYVVGTFLLFRLRIPPVDRQPGNVFRELVEGLAFIGKSNLFASLIALTFIDSFFGIAYIQILPIFARDILEIGVDGMGILLSASAAGGIIGTFLAAFVARGRRPRLLLLGGAASFGVTIMVFAISPWLWLSLLALFFSGVTNSLSLITNQTILQAAVPEALRGRVMGVFSLTYSMIPLGGLQVGILADRLGAPAAVTIGGGIAVLFAVFLAVRPSFGRDVVEATNSFAHR